MAAPTRSASFWVLHGVRVERCGWRDLIGVRMACGYKAHQSAPGGFPEVGGNGFNGPSDFAFSINGDHLQLMRITG
jgi:hypothetical protein